MNRDRKRRAQPRAADLRALEALRRDVEPIVGKPYLEESSNNYLTE